MKQNHVDSAESLRLRHVGEEKRRELVFERGAHPAAEAHRGLGTIPPCSLCAVAIDGECVIVRLPAKEEYIIACLDCARAIGKAAELAIREPGRPDLKPGTGRATGLNGDLPHVVQRIEAIERRLADPSLDPLVRRDLEEELTRVLAERWERERDARAAQPTIPGDK